jgi:hypothetical protein
MVATWISALKYENSTLFSGFQLTESKLFILKSSLFLQKIDFLLWEQLGTLNITKKELASSLCPKCEMAGHCEAEGQPGKLNVSYLEGQFQN